MKNVTKKIEVVSNIAIIIVALLFGGVLISRYMFSSPASPQPVEAESIKAGMKLPITNIDWSKSDKNLLLVVSTNCHFCTESAPFYQKLAQQNAGRGDVRLIAAMPQSVDDAQHYLKEHNISVDEVKQESLDDMNVRGTPTLIMVDRNGAVVQSWVGKLPPEKQAEVINKLFGGNSDV